MDLDNPTVADDAIDQEELEEQKKIDEREEKEKERDGKLMDNEDDLELAEADSKTYLKSVKYMGGWSIIIFIVICIVARFSAE